MKDFATSVIGFVGVFGVMALALAAIGFYAVAFEAGAEEWFGWEGWWVPALFLVGVFVFRAGLLLAAGMFIGGYGAYYAWDWPLWAVVPVFFPGLAFMIGGLLVAAIGSTVERARG
ncbi:hypothetical protein SAMN04488498_103133 [Mesorhizobium albiziae]|uniref:Uncharacterized protein n=1 Tax=Neomesorhizobium albiziae TaxID=335020 RepID=A0A1I3XCI6_9HYPH|nr:hypothetical protein [Mesorhizobium albiziae]GLS30551.1 hypothetical protein GCM10007937_22590 [Mesorhizobium albiziae]SFK17197.1 hypothetical protein SAMN04488498_103133 [Mesorhizobium albiziae]